MQTDSRDKDLQVGGKYWETKESMLAVASAAGFDQSIAYTIDQHEGPIVLLKRNNVQVGSLWINKEGGYQVIAEHYGKKDSLFIKDANDAKAINDFLLETWKDWNMGYNPQKVEESEIVSINDEFLVLDEEGCVNTFRVCPLGDDLTSIITNFNIRLVEYNYKNYVLEN